MASAKETITIPENGFPALERLVHLSKEQLSQLAKAVDGSKQKSLDLSLTIRELATTLGFDEKEMVRLSGLLMALNQIRIDKGLSPEELVHRLTNGLAEQATEEWKKKSGQQWREVAPLLPCLFRPNNIFSIARKTQELWANRPARVYEIKILSDLRPVFDEDAACTKAMVLTNTLVIDYFDDSSNEPRSIHLSLDQDDLKVLAKELDRVQRKNATISSETRAWGIDLLTFGGE